jgi:hypothetical protein
MTPLLALSLAAQDNTPSGENCTFRTDPDHYLEWQSRVRRDVADRTAKIGRMLRQDDGERAVNAQDIPRRGFIDAEIFDRLVREKVPSARLTTDFEFVRRIHLDATGRIPSPEQVRAFLADNSADKRERLIDRLVYSPEFAERWTMFFGDLLSNNSVQSNINRQLQGRNAFHEYIWRSVADSKPWRDMAMDMITAGGNNYDGSNGQLNFLLGGRAVMGPTQDIYDLMLYQTADRFLGLGHYDCLLCHDGRRHLDQLSVWGTGVTRLEAQRMAAFFSRTNIVGFAGERDSFYANSFIVTERPTGNYALNTNFGNRPNRVRVGTLAAVDAEYRDGSKPGLADWRWSLAFKVVDDPMFSINMANRLWKAVFNYGLVEPVNGLDPARLDPDNPPPTPWQLQASHPRLLARLAEDLRSRDYNVREFLRMLFESSAYQLSSRYDDAGWTPTMVPLFARHYPRRLEGEEVHDAIAKATNVMTNYSVTGWAQPAQWAVQLPEPREPISNGASLTFMNVFLRGNRDGVQRSQSGSILQQLSLMNDAFVTNRTKVSASSTLRALAANASNEAVVDEMFLLFLSRPATPAERATAVGHLAKAPNAATRNTYVEDLAWTLINKIEFIFSH